MSPVIKLTLDKIHADDKKYDYIRILLMYCGLCIPLSQKLGYPGGLVDYKSVAWNVSFEYLYSEHDFIPIEVELVSIQPSWSLLVDINILLTIWYRSLITSP